MPLLLSALAIALSLFSLLASFVLYRRSQNSAEVFGQHSSLVRNHLTIASDKELANTYVKALRNPGEEIETGTATQLYFLLSARMSHYEMLKVARPGVFTGDSTSSRDSWERVVEEVMQHELYQIYWNIERMTFDTEFRNQVDSYVTVAPASASKIDGLLRFCEAVGKANWDTNTSMLVDLTAEKATGQTATQEKP